MEESKVSFADKEKVEGRLYSYLRFETINIRITCTEGFPWTRTGFTGHLSANTSAKNWFLHFFFRRIGNSYRNIAFTDFLTNKVVFGRAK